MNRSTLLADQLLNGFTEQLKTYWWIVQKETQMEFGLITVSNWTTYQRGLLSLSGFIFTRWQVWTQSEPLEVTWLVVKACCVPLWLLGMKNRHRSILLCKAGVSINYPSQYFILMVLQYPLLANLLPHYVFTALIPIEQASLLFSAGIQCNSSFGRWLLMSPHRFPPATSFSSKHPNYGR